MKGLNLIQPFEIRRIFKGGAGPKFTAGFRESIRAYSQESEVTLNIKQ